MSDISHWKFRNGGSIDQTAFFMKFHRQLLAYTRKKVMNHHDAKDIVSETFIKVNRTVNVPDKFESEEKLQAYLFRAMDNGITDYFRKEESRRKANLTAIEEVPDIDTIEGELETNKFYYILIEEIDAQPPQRKKVSGYYYLEGKKVDEIVTEMKIAPTTVRGHLAEFVKYMKNKYKGFPLEDLPFLSIAGTLFALAIIFF
jgi:RNA polymerase sigma factor (sigma-70 family)